MNPFEQHTVLVQINGSVRNLQAGSIVEAMDRLVAGVATDESGRTLKPGEIAGALRRAINGHAQFRFRGSRDDVHPVRDFVQMAEAAGLSVRTVTTHRENGNQLRTIIFIPKALGGADFRASWEGESRVPMLDAVTLDGMLSVPGGAAQVMAWCQVAQHLGSQPLLPFDLTTQIEARAA